MYNKTTYPVCDDCLPAEEADFTKVRDIIAEEPGMEVARVVEVTGVEFDVVKRMLDDDMVKIAEPVLDIKCIQCGARAVNIEKKLCRPCMERLNIQMASIQRDIRHESKQVVVEEKPPKNMIETFTDKRR